MGTALRNIYILCGSHVVFSFRQNGFQGRKHISHSLLMLVLMSVI